MGIAVIAAAGCFVALSDALDAGPRRTSALLVFVAGIVVGAVGALYVFGKEWARSAEDIKRGTGGVGMNAAALVVALFLPFVFFNDQLPLLMAMPVWGLLIGFLFSAGVWTVLLGRKWQRMGF